MQKKVRYVQKNNKVYKETDFLGFKYREYYGTVKNGKVKKDTSLWGGITSYLSDVAYNSKKANKQSNKTQTKSTRTSSKIETTISNSQGYYNSNSNAGTDKDWIEYHENEQKGLVRSTISMEYEAKKQTKLWIWGIVIMTVVWVFAYAFAITKISEKRQENAIPVYTCTYYTSTGGYIKYEGNSKLYSGYIVQNVKSGNYGAKITAVPKDGYEFEMWSDGYIYANRTDCVTKEISVTAIFRLIEQTQD